LRVPQVTAVSNPAVRGVRMKQKVRRPRPHTRPGPWCPLGWALCLTPTSTWQELSGQESGV